jgi:hypothetical protein
MAVTLIEPSTVVFERLFSTTMGVFGLVGVTALNVLLERHYVKEGRATDVEFTTKYE